jgi:hypothetical protein
VTELPPSPRPTSEPPSDQPPTDASQPAASSAVGLEVTEDGFQVTAPTYRLRIHRDSARAVLGDADGRLWSDLSLLSSLDRTDQRDETLVLEPVRLVHQSADRCVFAMSSRSSVWEAKETELVCEQGSVTISVEVAGHGTLSDVSLLGGRAFLLDGACGTFPSGIGFASVFNPTPTEPVQVVRPATSSVVLGVVGDADPGRLHGIFTPPPLVLAFGRGVPLTATGVPAGAWLGLSVVAAVSDLTLTQCGYDPVDGGFLIRLDYDGHTEVSGRWRSPRLVLRPAETPWQAIRDYREDLVDRGFAPVPVQVPYAWWRQPIFCGWGAQCAGAVLAGQPAPALARQDFYDELMAGLAAADLDPGTVVIDDQWQADYGTLVPDPVKWPDLRGWIADQHGRGRKVLLWWKSWDPGSLPAAECITDPTGRRVAVDPSSAGYRDRVRQIVHDLLGADGLDADGFKIDFTQRAPMGASLTGAGPQWGIAALHLLLATIYDAAKATKPDALVITHSPHPSFGDVCDMVRLNDVLQLDPAGRPVNVVDQLRFRSAVVTAALPGHLIDTDQWPMPSREQWLAYADEQPRLGIPALYYVRSVGTPDESITADDLKAIGLGWRTYRAGLLPPDARTLSSGLTYADPSTARLLRSTEPALPGAVDPELARPA